MRGKKNLLGAGAPGGFWDLLPVANALRLCMGTLGGITRSQLNSWHVINSQIFDYVCVCVFTDPNYGTAREVMHHGKVIFFKKVPFVVAIKNEVVETPNL